MEVKINKEIREYTENIYFGLSLRQFSFSVLGCISTLISYFLFKDIFGVEITSWICTFIALPFILFGFFKYNGMQLETFLVTILKSKLLIPKKLKFESENIYYELIKSKKEDKKKDD